MGYGHGMIGGGFSIIFWILIIGVVYFFFTEYNKKNNQSSPEPKNGQESAEEIARQRYAKGEISKEELDEILNTLNH